MQNLILNRYRPITIAGKGGFSTVQVAWDTRILRRVAIKCLQLDERNIGGNILNVPGLSEARTAALLSDPTIVGIYDFEVEGNMAYIIMEYVEGLTLTQLMELVSEPLPMDVISVIFDSVAQALQIAHSNQVLHLDIKPDNILINREGRVKVLDFGLAQLSHSMGYGQAGGGTIGYMPLEQIRMESPDERTDEWSLAAILYEMLTGENPFGAPNLEEAEGAIERAELVVPSVVRDDVHPAMDDVIFDALAIDREDRFDSVTDFADALDPYLGDSIEGAKILQLWMQNAGEDDEVEDDEDSEETEEDLMIERVVKGTKKFAISAASAAVVGSVGFVGLSNMPDLFGLAENPPFVLAGLVVMLVAACMINPAFGCAVALALFVIGLCFQGQYLVAFAMAFAAAAWWGRSGRKTSVHSACGVISVVASGIGFGALAPLLAGYFLRTKDAIIASAFSFLLAFVLGASSTMSIFDWSFQTSPYFSAGLEDNLVAMLTTPSTWIYAIAWVATAAIVSACCSKGYRSLAFFGMILASVLMCGSVLISAYVMSDFTNWTPDTWTMVTTGTSCGIMAFCSLVGVQFKAHS